MQEVLRYTFAQNDTQILMKQERKKNLPICYVMYYK